MSETVSDSIRHAVSDIEGMLVPLTEDISTQAPNFLGTVLFMLDGWHGDASVIATADAPVSEDALVFNRTNIRDRRVDPSASTVGDVFESQQGGAAPSRMNPGRHMVWSEYLDLPDSPAVLQLAFDITHSGAAKSDLREIPDPSPQLEPRLPDIKQAIGELLVTARKHQVVSLGDELRLNMPVTPNAFIFKWDVTDSTTLVRHNYPKFRTLYQGLGLSALQIAGRYGDNLIAPAGDGQNIVLWLPKTVDRNNARQISTFGKNIAQSLARDLIAEHSRLALESNSNFNIRLGVGFGRVEILQTGEVNGPVFWEVAKLLDPGTPSAPIVYTDAATEALLGSLYRQTSSGRGA